MAEVIKYDDLFRKELARRKYIQENRMLPADEPVKMPRKDFEIPKAGVDLALARGSLAKNVSVWKKRINDPRYPEAEQKHAMYVALYQEAKTAAATERARIQSLANESYNND